MKQLNVYVIDAMKYSLAGERLVGKGCNSCNNRTCRVPSDEKENVCECAGWTNSNLQKKAVILENYDVYELQNIPDFDGDVILNTDLLEKRIEYSKAGYKIKKLF